MPAGGATGAGQAPPGGHGARSVPRMRSALALWLTLAAAALPGQEPVHLEPELQELGELIKAMPEAGPFAPEDAPRPEGLRELAKGVGIEAGRRVVLSAVSLFDQGPVDGLEVLLSLDGGKSHESFAQLPTANGELVKTAFIVGLGLHVDGVPAPEASAVPARGVPLRVRAYWRPDPLLEPDRWVRRDASTLVRDRYTDRAYPPLPYVYTGSHVEEVEQMMPSGDVRRVRRFMLSVTRSVAVNYDEPDALLASPFPLAARDDLFEVNSRSAPLPDTEVLFSFERAELPLTLHLGAEGRLEHGGGPLEDAMLDDLLSTHFAEPELHAVAVTVARDAPREWDVAARLRIMERAAAAGVWCVPVFVLEEPAR